MRRRRRAGDSRRRARPAHRTDGDIGLFAVRQSSVTDRLRQPQRQRACAHPRGRAPSPINFLHEEHALLALTFSGQKGVNGDDRFAFGQMDRRRDRRADAGRCRCRVRLRADAGVGDQDPFDIRRRSAGRVLVRAEPPLLYLRRSFHGPREIRDALSLGDVDARRLSWSDFS